MGIRITQNPNPNRKTLVCPNDTASTMDLA
jgi:hypothetical protein